MNAKFNPDFPEYIKDRMNNRYSGVQAIKLLGISESKFYDDLSSGKIKSVFHPARKSRVFIGQDLYDYYMSEIVAVQLSCD